MKKLAFLLVAAALILLSAAIADPLTEDIPTAAVTPTVEEEKLPVAAAVELRPDAVYQGDAVTAEIRGGTPVAGVFDGEDVAVFPYGDSHRAVFGIPATKPPGIYVLRLELSDGRKIDKNISVREKDFPKIVLGIPKELGLTPSGLVGKLQTGKVSLDEIFGKRTSEIFFREPFGLPLADVSRISSVFGEIRKTGDTEIRHMGADFGAEKGAAVKAMNGGVVRKAYFDTVYGNSVILDHGQGIFSFYIHLNEIKIKESDTVEKGDLIGTVGRTGYSTAPHLHLSVKIGGVAVDPVGFVRNFR